MRWSLPHPFGYLPLSEWALMGEEGCPEAGWDYQPSSECAAKRGQGCSAELRPRDGPVPNRSCQTARGTGITLWDREQSSLQDTSQRFPPGWAWQLLRDHCREEQEKLRHFSLKISLFPPCWAALKHKCTPRRCTPSPYRGGNYARHFQVVPAITDRAAGLRVTRERSNQTSSCLTDASITSRWDSGGAADCTAIR